MLLIYSALTGLILGTANYLYFRTQGYTSYTILILGIFAFTSIAYMLLKFVL